jgi:hypothetical protein
MTAKGLTAPAPEPAPATPTLATLSFVVTKAVMLDLDTAHQDFNALRADLGDPPVPFGVFLVNGLLRAGLGVLTQQMEAHRTKERLVVLAGAAPRPRPGAGVLLGGSTVWR